MVLILIIGIVTAMGLPRFLRSPVPVTQDFIHRVNILITDAVGQAQQEGEPRRIFFNLGARFVEIQTAGGKRLGGSLAIPPEVEISDVVINGENQFQAGGGRTFYSCLILRGLAKK